MKNFTVIKKTYGKQNDSWGLELILQDKSPAMQFICRRERGLVVRQEEEVSDAARRFESAQRRER